MYVASWCSTCFCAVQCLCTDHFVMVHLNLTWQNTKTLDIQKKNYFFESMRVIIHVCYAIMTEQKYFHSYNKQITKFNIHKTIFFVENCKIYGTCHTHSNKHTCMQQLSSNIKVTRTWTRRRELWNTGLCGVKQHQVDTH